jgi:hypothetical protein
VKILIGLLLLAGALTGQSNDWLIVPGSRVGPITAATTHEDLIKLFGATNVVDEEVTVTDGGPEPGTVIFQNRPYDSLSIVWSPEHKISVIVACYVQWPDPKDCHWHTREGITFGTTLKALERLNGRAFQLAGFAFDGSGAVTSWEGGRLAHLSAPSCGSVFMRLDPHPRNPSEERLFDQLIGDRFFSSTIPGMQVLNPEVNWLEMSFADCAHDSRPLAD